MSAYKIGVQFDADGNFVDDFLDDMTLPEGHVLYTGVMPEGLYTPKLVDGEVVEELSQQEIEDIQNTPQEPTIEDRMTAAENVITSLLGLGL